MKKFVAGFASIPKWTKIGVLGIVFMYVSVAGITSAAIPWWIGKGDSALHIDYALSVYKGEIPKYHDYIQYPIFHQLDKGYKTQIQRAAANPPLFYTLHAPIIGPSLEAGQWEKAIGLGRAFNVFLGVLVVLALAWAGWLFGGKRKELFAVAVPGVGSLIYQFTNLNQNYALDVLLVLFGVLTSVTWYKLLEHGFKMRYVAGLFLLSILGMSTKASYIIFLALSFLAVMMVAFMHGKGSRLKKFFKGSLISGAILAAVIISIGWFYYYWNYKTSGSFFDAELPGDFKSRVYKPFSKVIIHPGLWSNFFSRLTSFAELSSAITAASIPGIILAASKTKVRELLKNKFLLFNLSLLALLLILTTATQIAHAVGVGQFGFRYFLPAMLVFSLFVSYGLLEIKQARGQLMSAALAAMAITSVMTIARLDNIKDWVPAVGATKNVIKKLDIAMISNGFPAVVLILLLVLLAVGIGLMALSLFKLTNPAKQRA